jgi:four helix bundle protein
MRENVLKTKSFAFAVRIVNVYKFLISEKKEFVMSKQLLKSGTAVGALYREAEQAESKLDFIHKMGIAQKECNETIYWLELLHATEYLDETQFNSINSDAIELMKLITSIIKSSKTN